MRAMKKYEHGASRAVSDNAAKRYRRESVERRDGKGAFAALSTGSRTPGRTIDSKGVPT